ncbi:MAG: SMI1/KNR4 family protein, partial [Chloroflexota bacterium]|nr:SMI1/KNR4 family protein [Chloroflexota bacterium]
MATIRKAAELIEGFPEYANFAGGVPFEEVWVAEQQLGVTFPDSYRDYLQRYGAGSFGGLVVFGL